MREARHAGLRLPSPPGILASPCTRRERRSVAAGFALLVSLALACVPAAAHAADCGPGRGLTSCIDADNLWPHAGASRYFALGGTSTTPSGSVAVGLVGSFLSDPIGVRVASADPAGSTVFLVDAALDATLLLAFGVTDRFEITLAAPGTLYQGGAGLAAVAGAAPPPPHTAARDLRFGFAYAFLERAPERDGPALAGRVEFAAPTGSSYAFAAGPTAVLAPSLAFSYRLGIVDLAAELGARVRGEATLANAVVGSEVFVGLGASVDVLKQGWLAVGAEAFALPSTSTQLAAPPATGSGPPLVPAEWIAHVSTAHFAGGDLAIELGGGGTLPFTSHGAPTSPKYRLDLAVRYAPSSRRGRACTAGACEPASTKKPPPPTPGASDPR